MAGYMLLAGGAEFGGQMAAPDRRAIELAGGADVPVRIIPTAAAPDNNHARAGHNGARWFQSLGATNVQAVALIDKESANSSAIAAELRAARLIYMLGGFTAYLEQTLVGSACWDAVLVAYRNGAVVAGSSAGAMVLCEFCYNPQVGGVDVGLGLIPGACVIPHYNTFGQRWVTKLRALLPAATLIGIDERTGMLDDEADGTQSKWRVYGQGVITLHRGDEQRSYKPGQPFSLAW